MNTSYRWSDLFPEEEPVAEGPDQPPLPPGHGLHPPADESEVIRLEEQLGVNLPPSYRQFLLYSDGWGVEEYSLWPAAEVGWLRDIAPTTIEPGRCPQTKCPMTSTSFTERSRTTTPSERNICPTPFWSGCGMETSYSTPTS
ncbi:SMI1/KNR4 family protein [Microbispora sp. H10949]|uniref:SMI1/KNR4 family protein n=1 Tax=Microbispora sp. H10949 TaxID=2729111 RepID=UPI0016025C28|nr:SMI1/KNR4 family protein [Microbispora sp. H10949]